MTVAEFWVPGRARTYGDSKIERPWRETIAAHVGRPVPGMRVEGVRFEFVLPSLRPNGQPLDVDNLCEVPFAALTRDLGWFDGDRQRVRWWDARKREAQGDEEPGVRVRFESGSRADEPEGACLVDACYRGPLPVSARDLSVNAWAWEVRSRTCPRTVPDRATLWLAFGASSTNIAAINGGAVKPMIDCLYPLVGGAFGNPEDHRFERIVVTQGDAIGDADVRVRIEARELVESALMPRPEAGTGEPGRGRVAAPVAAEGGAARREGMRSHNPCVPGTGKWVVVEAAIRRWPLERVRRELEALGAGRGARIREYLSDVRSENRIRLFIEGDFIVERTVA